MSDPFLSVYGHVAVDQIMTVRKFPADNTTEDILTKVTALGGTGTNIAVVAARLGCPTALCAFVGNDFPGAYERQIQESGLILDEFVHVDDYQTSGAMVVNDPNMVQKVVFYQGPQGFADDIGIMDIVIFVTKATQLESAVQSAMPCIGPDTVLVSLINGLGNDDILLRHFPANRILCGSGALGTQLKEPGCCVSTEVEGTLVHFGALEKGVR